MQLLYCLPMYRTFWELFLEAIAFCVQLLSDWMPPFHTKNTCVRFDRGCQKDNETSGNTYTISKGKPFFNFIFEILKFSTKNIIGRSAYPMNLTPSTLDSHLVSLSFFFFLWRRTDKWLDQVGFFFLMTSNQMTVFPII